MNSPEANCGFCAVCQKPITRPEERRVIQHAGREFSAHGFCLVRLRRLACDLVQTPAPVPTLFGPYTLNEFLLIKRPRSDVEILGCVAFYLESKMKEPVPLTVQGISEQLRFTGFKIDDVNEAFRQATQRYGYFIRCSNREVVGFCLTAKGTQAVEQLPSLDD